MLAALSSRQQAHRKAPSVRIRVWSRCMYLSVASHKLPAEAPMPWRARQRQRGAASITADTKVFFYLWRRVKCGG